jgi:hypothetical protein
MSVKHLYPVAVAAIMACAGAPASTSGTLPVGVLPRRPNILTLDEMAAAHADVATAYDAIARLRPNWLAGHGLTSTLGGGGGTEFAIVFVDGQSFGDLNSLRTIPAYEVSGFRYYNITEAGAKFGLRGGSSGVIEVITTLTRS